MKKINNYWLFFTTVFFTLFMLNIIIGKIILNFDLGKSAIIGNVGEFLILLIAVLCFVANILVKEYELNLRDK